MASKIEKDQQINTSGNKPPQNPLKCGNVFNYHSSKRSIISHQQISRETSTMNVIGNWCHEREISVSAPPSSTIIAPTPTTLTHYSQQRRPELRWCQGRRHWPQSLKLCLAEALRLFNPKNCKPNQSKNKVT